jgi:hypothetical protein
MERTITHVKRSLHGTQLVFINSETGEETRKTPVEYHYSVYYSTPSKPNNYRSIRAYSEEEAVAKTKAAFAKTDAHYAKRNQGAN